MKKKSIRVLACLLAAFALLFTLAACGETQPVSRFYGSGNTGVTLNDDQTFVANLYHGVVKTGTYEEQESFEGYTLVIYTVGGEELIGTIFNNILTIPQEWADGHGHGSSFPLR